jgi:cyclophilin family peptidyl-prolyl cis-trans isomerase
LYYRKHVVFGKVVDGMDILSKIEQCPTGVRDRPEKPIKVSSSGEVSREKSNGVSENGKGQNCLYAG